MHNFVFWLCGHLFSYSVVSHTCVSVFCISKNISFYITSPTMATPCSFDRQFVNVVIHHTQLQKYFFSKPLIYFTIFYSTLQSPKYSAPSNSIMINLSLKSLFIYSKKLEMGTAGAVRSKSFDSFHNLLSCRAV